MIPAQIDGHPLPPIRIGPCRFQRRRRRRRLPPTSHHQSRSRIRQPNPSRNLRIPWSRRDSVYLRLGASSASLRLTLSCSSRHSDTFEDALGSHLNSRACWPGDGLRDDVYRKRYGAVNCPTGEAAPRDRSCGVTEWSAPPAENGPAINLSATGLQRISNDADQVSRFCTRS